MRALGISAFAFLLCVAGSFFYLCFGSSWQGVAKQNIGIFPSESGAAYEGSQSIKTQPAISSVKQGEPVAVLWDTYGKDYWACYVRSSAGERGWVLCTSLVQG